MKIKYLFEDAPQNLESLITADKTASFNRRQVNRKSSKASIWQTSEKRNLCSQNLHRFLPYLLPITNQVRHDSISAWNLTLNLPV